MQFSEHNMAAQDMEVKFIPKSKFDDEACHHLAKVSNEDIEPYLTDLLECLQDLNWPIAGPVSERLSQVGVALVNPTLEVLSGTDEIWKYWIVSHLLHIVKPEVYQGLIFKLNSMRNNPTKEEIKEEVHSAVRELLQARPYK